MNTIKEMFEVALKNTLKIIPSQTYTFEQANNEDVLKKYQIEPDKFVNALNNKFGNYESFKKVLHNI